MEKGTETGEQGGDSGGNRPLSRRASRLLVIGVVIFAILFAVYTTIMIIRTSNDPVVRDAVEEFQRQESAPQTPRADTTTATTPN